MKRNYMVARAGRIGEDENYALDHNLSIIGFRSVGSLENIDSYDEIKELVAKASPEKPPRAISNLAGQLGYFVLGMHEGDIVVLPQKLTSQIAIGTITGPYQFRKINNEHRHVRPVNWKRIDVPRTSYKQDLLYSFGAYLTVYK